MSFDARAVANYFLDRADEEGAELDHMSLQKLVYIAHGWHLATRGEPLFDNPILAWPYGPVLPDVYSEFKHVGLRAIRSRAFTYQPTLDEVREYDIRDADLTYDAIQSSREVLDHVWQSYKDYSGSQLGELTNGEGSPWHEVTHDKKRADFRGLTISNESIRRYYTSLARRNHQHAR